jgi:hypothetical protein
MGDQAIASFAVCLGITRLRIRTAVRGRDGSLFSRYLRVENTRTTKGHAGFEALTAVTLKRRCKCTGWHAIAVQRRPNVGSPILGAKIRRGTSLYARKGNHGDIFTQFVASHACRIWGPGFATYGKYNVVVSRTKEL